MNWNIESASAKAQMERRNKVFSMLRKLKIKDLKRENGRTEIHNGKDYDDKRLHLWIASAFLHGNEKERRIGSELIASVEFNHSCHFCAAASATLLNADIDKLEKPAIKNLENFLLANFSEWMTDDYAFQGANDNAPAGCTVALSLGGQYFGNKDLVDFARKRLEYISHIIDFRGYINECNSPTYSAATLSSFAEIAESSSDPETKKLALHLEERVWQEVLIHFHPELKQMVGPFSRGYPDDNANQCTMLMFAFYTAFGEVSPFNPVNMLFPPPEGTFAHNTWDFQHRSLAYIAAPTYHPPAKFAKSCFERKFPFASTGSNEFMGFKDVPGGDTTVNTYMKEDYGLGSFGSRLWAGQTVPLMLLYRRRPVKDSSSTKDHLEAIRSVYTRMTISDTFDSMQLRPQLAENEVFLDHGAAFSVQSGSSAILAYVPVTMKENVKTIRASVVLPTHHSMPDEVRFEDRKITGFSASYNEHGWCFLRDGDVYIGVHPLVTRTEDAMLALTKFANCANYCLISFYNMCGFEGKTFTREKLRSFGNGMIFETGSKKEFGSFENFMKAMKSSSIKDSQWGTEREISYSRKGVSLEMKIDVQQLNVRRALVNGKLVGTAMKLECSPAMKLIE